MHFCCSTFRQLQTDWFPIETNSHLSHIRPQDLVMVESYIDTFFDAHIKDPLQKVSVPFNCPHPWPPMLDPVWNVCHDEEVAAKFLGNLYCRQAIKRPERWWSFPYAILEWKPRLYVVEHHLKARLEET